MRNRNLHTAPPADDSFKEWLRYLVQSCPKEAPELAFLVTAWHEALSLNGLTAKLQADVMPFIEEGCIFLNTYVYKPEPAPAAHELGLKDLAGYSDTGQPDHITHSNIVLFIPKGGQ